MSLITITDVSTYCPFFGDGEEKTQKINIGITKAEDKLLGLLCEDTFDLLVTAVDDVIYPAGYLGLYNIVKKFLAWEAFANYLKYSQVTDTDAGLRVFQESNSQTADGSLVIQHVKNAEEDASGYKAEMLSYLERNISDFAEYKESSCRKCQDRVIFSGKFSGAGTRKRTLPRSFNKPY